MTSLFRCSENRFIFIMAFYDNFAWRNRVCSLTFRELSEIFSRNLCIVDIILFMIIASLNMALGTSTKFQLAILTSNMISDNMYVRKIILESSRNVSETTPWVKVHGVTATCKLPGTQLTFRSDHRCVKLYQSCSLCQNTFVKDVGLLRTQTERHGVWHADFLRQWAQGELWRICCRMPEWHLYSGCDQIQVRNEIPVRSQ